LGTPQKTREIGESAVSREEEPAFKMAKTQKTPGLNRDIPRLEPQFINRVSNVSVTYGKHGRFPQTKQMGNTNMSVHKHISIREDQAEFVEKHYISLSAFVQDMIDKHLLGMEGEAFCDG